MIAIVHSIYSQSVHAPARDAGLMDNDAERYCNSIRTVLLHLLNSLTKRFDLQYNNLICLNISAS